MHELFFRIVTGLSLVVLLSFFYFLVPLGLSLFFLVLITHLLRTELPRVLVFCQHIFYKVSVSCYFVIALVLLMMLNYSPQRSLLVVLFGMVFIFDSASYGIGKLYGRHLIWPALSPKKTWEGLIGGIACTLCATLGIAYFFRASLHPGLIPFTFFMCVLAFLGDLFESFLKRKAQLKDTGGLLPGHGGILDRFDSIILVSYFFYFLREPLMELLGF